MGSFVAVELVFDPEAARRLTVLQDRLAAIYGGPKITELGVKPHLSLNLFPDGEPAFLCDELEELARRFNPFPVRLGSVEQLPHRRRGGLPCPRSERRIASRPPSLPR